MKGRFPTLASIARDIFAIPAFYRLLRVRFRSVVVSSQHRRSSLLPRSLKHLVCTRSWLKNVCAIESNEVMIDIKSQKMSRRPQKKVCLKP
ncbi:hypothetical protein Dimus_036183 [Dionaea muscipula]